MCLSMWTHACVFQGTIQNVFLSGASIKNVSKNKKENPLNTCQRRSVQECSLQC